VLSDPFRGMRAWRNSTETQQSGTPQGLDQRSINGRNGAEYGALEAQMRDSQGGGESYPAEGVRRRCIMNSPSVLSCIGKRTKKGCDRGSEVETVHSE